MNLPPQQNNKASGPIQLMLADDSSVIRSALSKVISPDPAIEIVSSVANGEVAISAAKRHQPDVIILDIEMPVMDGLTALPKILEASPQSKIIMFSALTEAGASVTLKAFALGAVECIVKPSAAQDVGPGSQFQATILKTIKALMNYEQESTAAPRARTSTTPGGAFALRDDALSYKGKPAAIAIGSSTGGPQALMDVTAHLKDLSIPIIITQHMPATFTKILAQHIRQHSGIPTFEGEDGMPLEGGRAYVAPGGFHMHIVNKGGRAVIHLNNGAPENFCKPSVDPMFRTAFDFYGKKMLCLILTGMGNDGLSSSEMLVKEGVRLIAQDEATSVVWGMPGAVAKAGLCSAVLPLKEIGPWIKNAILNGNG